MPSSQDLDVLLTTTEAAEELGISPGRVRQLVLDDRLPAQKVGRDLLILRRDLEQVRHRRPGRPAGYRPRDGGGYLSHPSAVTDATPSSTVSGTSRPVGGEWLVPAATARPRRR